MMSRCVHQTTVALNSCILKHRKIHDKNTILNSFYYYFILAIIGVNVKKNSHNVFILENFEKFQKDCLHFQMK